MKTKTIKLSIAIILAGILGYPSAYLRAQNDSTGTPVSNSPQGGSEKMLLAGEIFTNWQNTKINSFTQNGVKIPSVTANSFGSDGLMLMPLVKLTKNLFVDVQMGVDPTAGASLGEAIIYYHVANGLDVFAGYFQPRSGLYEGILDDFTNRYVSDPVGMGIGVSSEMGAGIQGGIQCGYSKLVYQLYVANGPQLVVDSTGAANGQLNYGNYTDNNMGKAVGGEIGFLPFSNSCLEIGISGQYTPSTGNAGSPLENISSTSMAAYLNYYHFFSPLTIRIQGQYEFTQTQKYNLYTNQTDTAILLPSFSNQISGWYAGATFCLNGVRSRFLKNLELAARLGQLTLPQDINCAWGAKPLNQTTVALTYWFTWKTPLSIAYDIYTQSGAPTQTAFTVRGMWFF